MQFHSTRERNFRERKGWVVGPKLSGICRLASMCLLPSHDRILFMTWHSQQIRNIAVLLRFINTMEAMLLGTNRGPDGLPCVPCSQNSKLAPTLLSPLGRVRTANSVYSESSQRFTTEADRGGSL